MVVDVIIPCVPTHTQHLPDVLQSIRDNTMAPDHVIIALSETSAATCAGMRDELQRVLGDAIPLRMTCTESKANASTNRNRGARLSTADILMFFDADDLMLRDRIAALVSALRTEGADAVLHAFTRDAAYAVETGVVGPCVSVEEATAWEWNIGHGHVTYTRRTFWEIGGFPEHKDLQEDSTMTDRAVAAGKRVVVVPRPLSVYRQHLSNDSISRFMGTFFGSCQERWPVIRVVLLVLVLIVAVARYRRARKG